MRDISNLPGQTLLSEMQGGDFSFAKENLISQFGGSNASDPWVIAGQTYTQSLSINYYDAASASDGLVDNTGWNRKLVFLGNNLEFNSDGFPTSGDIEAIVFMNVHEQVLVGAIDLEGVSAADFYAAWSSNTLSDDTTFLNSIFDSDDPNGDLITGTTGDDVINGTTADNMIEAGTGNDSVDGGAGNDTISGAGGRDLLRGEEGNDKLFGNSGSDKLVGGTGGDVLKGGGGRDKLFGNSGSDKLVGGTGGDMLKGGSGRDKLLGGSGTDYLKGGRGNDKLDGGAGNDRLVGNAGADDFIFSSGLDLVQDFGSRDQVDLRKADGIDDYDDLIANHIQQGGDGVIIVDNDGDEMTLYGIDIADLDQGDFIF